MASINRKHHWSVAQHREQVRGRNGGLTSALTREGSRAYNALHEAIDRDMAEIEALVAEGMTQDEAWEEQRLRHNARVLAEYQAMKAEVPS